MSENEKDENDSITPDVSISKPRSNSKPSKIDWQTKDSFDIKDDTKEELQRSRGDQQKIDELNMLLEKQKKISKRLLSDYQNLERRQQTEISEGVSKIKDDLLKNFIVIYEDFIRAKDAYEKEEANVDNLNDIIKNMKSILENYDVKPIPIEETETKSDPNLHTVEEEIEDNDHEEGTIVKEIAKGYIIRGEVLKYSKVRVSKKIIKE